MSMTTTTLIPGSVTVQQGVLTGGARFESGRIVYVEVATDALAEDQKRIPIPELVVALADAIEASLPCPAKIVLDSRAQGAIGAPDGRVGQPVSPARRAAIDAVLAKLHEPIGSH
jgi:hypothetical protein